MGRRHMPCVNQRNNRRPPILTTSAAPCYFIYLFAPPASCPFLQNARPPAHPGHTPTAAAILLLIGVSISSTLNDISFAVPKLF